MLSEIPQAVTPALAQLQRDGYCVLKNILDKEMVQRLRVYSRSRIATLDEEHLKHFKAAGTMIDSNNMPEFAEVFAHEPALKAMNAIGLEDLKFWKANLISKPPHSPRNYWHQDNMLWHDPRSYSSMPPMIFLMYYLIDTSRENGCLRVIPGTHRRRHALHSMGEAHVGYINRMEEPDDPRFGDFEGEIDLPVKAGDLLIGDARLFHATHANSSNDWRTVITIWYHPFFSGLVESARRWLADSHHGLHEKWPAESKKRIETVTPHYNGAATGFITRQPDPAWTGTEQR
jgi:hypothetical protein